MDLVALRCPHCGGEVRMDESKEFGLCLHCGSRVALERRADRVSIDESSKVMSLVDAAFQFKDAGLEGDAYEYAKKALDIDPSEPQAWYVVGFTSPRVEERLVALRRAADLFDDEELKAGCEKAYGIVAEFLEKHRPDGKIKLNVVSELKDPCRVFFDRVEHRVEPGGSVEILTEPGYHNLKVLGSVDSPLDARLYEGNCKVRLRQTRLSAYITVEEDRPRPLRRYTVQSLRPA